MGSNSHFYVDEMTPKNFVQSSNNINLTPLQFALISQIVILSQNDLKIKTVSNRLYLKFYFIAFPKNEENKALPKKTSKCWTHHLLQYFSQLKLTLVRDTWVSLISTFLRLWFQSLVFCVPNVNLLLAKRLICLLFIFYNQIANVPNSKSLFCMLYKQN